LLKTALTATISKAAMDFAKNKASELMASNRPQSAGNGRTPTQATNNF
jgi:hypothetical protein